MIRKVRFDVLCNTAQVFFGFTLLRFRLLFSCLGPIKTTDYHRYLAVPPKLPLAFVLRGLVRGRSPTGYVTAQYEIAETEGEGRELEVRLESQPVLI